MEIWSRHFKFTPLILMTVMIVACTNDKTEPPGPNHFIAPDRYNVAFLIMDGVFNTELTAPFDIFHHTRFRENIKPMNVFLVADKSTPVIFAVAG